MLQTLAFAALIRNRPASLSRQRLIVALDIAFVFSARPM